MIRVGNRILWVGKDGLLYSTRTAALESFKD
ncbi:MAG: hypothetical protein UW28_C0013G0038 [Parcubacteria group bacterium GW2011_GWA2_44_13]|nr:MAG: hypothetical protein UW28_C0013G0038 [Parcubacteria group bacterium GW2011_GWA2_44_13]